MSGPADGAIVRLAAIDATLCAFDWRFSAEQRPAIDAYWARRLQQSPAMFNGRVLLQCEGEVAGDIFRARYFETDFADMLAWLHLDLPGTLPRNGFAMAALRAADGAFLLGRMGAHTANAGMVYFAAGTPDCGDVTPDGRVDLAGSVIRELAEETGLLAADIEIGEGWTAVFGNKRVAFMRDVRIDAPASEARALVLDRMTRLKEEELSDIVIIRSVADCDGHDMPSFMRAYLSYVFRTKS